MSADWSNADEFAGSRNLCTAFVVASGTLQDLQFHEKWTEPKSASRTFTAASGAVVFEIRGVWLLGYILFQKFCLGMKSFVWV